MPHRNNPTPSVAGRPYNHHEPSTKPTGRNKSRLSVIAPVIGQRYHSAFKDPVGVSEVQAALVQRRLALRLVPRIRH